MNQWVVETLVATTLLMLLVLAARPWVADRFGARAAYFLWFAPALRMVLPPLPASWFGESGAAMQDVVVVMAGVSSPSLQTATTAGGSTAWPMIIALSVWLGGAVLFFGRHWLSYLRFSRDVAVDGRELFDAGRIPVTASAFVSSPIALGVFGKAVFVPADFEHRFDEEEQRLAVAHELTHHERHDVPVNFLALAILAIHWWNPIAHIAHRAFRLDQEAACDAIVLDGASPAERHAYGSALFKSAMGQVPLAACAMGATTTLKARLKRICAGPVEARWAKPGSLLAGVLVITGVAATASGAVNDVVEPVMEAPRAIVLNGGIVEPGSVDTDAINAQVEREYTKAMAHARKAQAIAETARVRAERIVVTATREATAEAAAARAEAEATAAEARADAAEAVAEAQDAARDARANAVAAVRATRIRSKPVAACPTGATGHTVAFIKTINTADRGQMQLVICGVNPAAQRAQVIAALRATRAQIATEVNFPEGARLQVLAALDRQIAEMPEMPKPPLPPLSMQ